MIMLALVAGLVATATAVANQSCSVSPADRKDRFGDESTCVSKGCCWNPVDPNPHNYPWCFNKGSPQPSPRPTPPGPIPPPPTPPGPIPPGPDPSNPLKP